MGLVDDIHVFGGLPTKDGNRVVRFQTKTLGKPSMRRYYMHEGRLYGGDYERDDKAAAQDEHLVLSERIPLAPSCAFTMYATDDTASVYTLTSDDGRPRKVSHSPWVEYDVVVVAGRVDRCAMNEANTETAASLRADLEKRGLRILERDDPRFDLLDAGW